MSLKTLYFYKHNGGTTMGGQWYSTERPRGGNNQQNRGTQGGRQLRLNPELLNVQREIQAYLKKNHKSPCAIANMNSVALFYELHKGQKLTGTQEGQLLYKEQEFIELIQQNIKSGTCGGTGI